MNCGYRLAIRAIEDIVQPDISLLEPGLDSRVSTFAKQSHMPLGSSIEAGVHLNPIMDVRRLAIRSQPSTFWNSLCRDCRLSSVDKTVCRVIGRRTAWNVEGPVLTFYQEKLIYAINSTFETHKREILRGTNWERSVDC